MTKTAVDKNQATALIKELFKQYTACCNRPNPPTADDFRHCLTAHSRFSSNGHVVAKNLSEYLNRVAKFQKKYSRVELSNPKEILTCENKCIIRYDATLTPRSGEKNVIVHLMVIATVEDDRIISWEQVAHEEGTSHWDK